ncbi:MAG: PD40 domain-containing protein [Gemmatimonadetes bacterium]|nr:PD40 domain-containing protein [Gemmatimonadota bacterium]
MRRSIALAGCFLLLAAAAARAQTVPFGKNKIQYRDFDWHVLSGEHVDVYYYPEEETLARFTLSYAEESYRFLERKFQHHPFRRIPLIVYSSDQHFEQTNIFPGFIPEGVLGFTEYLKRRVALPFRGDYTQFRNTLRHELVHAFQLSKLAEVQTLHPRQRRHSPQHIHWWTEGLAEFWSSEQTSEDDMFIRDLVLTGRLPSIKEFSYLYSFASYPLGAELHKYLARRFGEEYIVELYEEYWKYDTFEDALAAVLGVELERLGREWKYELQQRYFPVYGERPPLEVGAVPVVYKGGANFKPVVYSPPEDSAQLLFLSPRTGYTSLYRTRLDGGERDVEVVVEGERSAEFESFHAYESGIDVSDAGVVAFVSKYLERDALFLWDLEKVEIVGRYQWPDLIGLKSPGWDPAGRKVVFEGLSTSGFSDLYTIDFDTQERTALTNDPFRDEDPDWSPDGQAIVFASDRTSFGQDGYTNLFLFDLRTGETRYLTYGRWHDQDPRWSHDGSRIAFSSDRGGIYDLYAIDAHGYGRRLTAMTGGAFDPEWLPDNRGLVFAGFSEGTFRIYKKGFAQDTATYPAVALERPEGERLALGDTPANSAPEPAASGWTWEGLNVAPVDSVKPERYNSWQKLSLDFAGGDAIVAPGIGSAQGAQFLASDLLGNHIVFAGISAAQAQDFSQFVDNFSGHLLYLNLAHRLNFGAGLFRFRGLFRDVAFDIYREETYGGYFVASYPFSKFERLELQLGLERSNRVDISDAFEEGLFGRTTRPDSVDLTRDGLQTSNFVSYV